MTFGIFHIIFSLGELLCKSCYLIGIYNLTTDKNRLLHSHGSYPEIMHVRMKSIINIPAYGIDRVGNIRCHSGNGGSNVGRFEHIENRLPHRTAHIIGSKRRIGLNRLHQLVHLVRHSSINLLAGSGKCIVELPLNQGAGIAKHLGLTVANKRDIPIIIHVRARNIDIREIIGKSRLLVISCHLHGNSSLIQLIGRADSHSPAVFYSKRLSCIFRRTFLCSSWELHCGRNKDGHPYTLFHYIYLFMILHQISRCKSIYKNTPYKDQNGY